MSCRNQACGAVYCSTGKAEHPLLHICCKDRIHRNGGVGGQDYWVVSKVAASAVLAAAGIELSRCSTSRGFMVSLMLLRLTSRWLLGTTGMSSWRWLSEIWRAIEIWAAVARSSSRDLSSRQRHIPLR